jgi:uncharacterized membrane protein YeaQ/YmgE (transglycosylase-associated protein family)
MLIAGLIAGALAGQLVRGSSFGLVGNIIVGLVGALVGGSLFRLLGLAPAGDFISTTIVAFVGAVALVWIAGTFAGRKTTV